VTQRVLFGAVLGAIVAGSLLVACSVEAPSLYDAVSPPADTSGPEILKPIADPVAISIPKIGAKSSLIPLGLTGVTKDCPSGDCLAVPPVDQPEQAAWYAGEKSDVDGDEYKPGSIAGPAIISGHVDGTGPGGRKGFAGVFNRLSELAAGDDVFVDQRDGGQLRFVVDRVESYDKASFPWALVMAKTGKPELRMITCGGDYDRSAGHYRKNTVAFATLAPEQL
jgi:sortase family protein